MYSRVEDERLQFIKSAKQNEAMQFAETDVSDDDVVDFTLPASFTGLPKYFADRTADSLALSRQIGKPDLLITTTTNPNWPELREALGSRRATECPQITVRVFRVQHSDIFPHILSLNIFHSRHDFQNLCLRSSVCSVRDITFM
jgi:hypothetical protein